MKLWLLLWSLWSISLQAVELNFLYYREQGKDTFLALLDEFSKQYQHQVTLHSIYSDTIAPALIKLVQQGRSPDVVFAASDLISMAEAAQLSEIPTQWVSEHTAPELLLTATTDQKLYGLPILQGNHLMLFYNRAYVGTPAKTWQELFEQDKLLKKQGIATIGWNYREMYWFAGFFNSFGGRMTQGKSVTLDQPAMQQALTFYKSLAAGGLISADCDYDCGYRDFIEGKVAYVINGEWAMADFEHHLAENLGIALIPSIGEYQFKPMSSTLVLLFPKHSLSSAKATALKQLSWFFQRTEVQQRLYDEVHFLPVNGPLIERIKQHSDVNEHAMLSQLERAIPMSAEAAQSSAWAGMRKGFELFEKDLLDAAKASQYMQQYAERDYILLLK